MTSAATHLLLLYALTELVACLSPGPAVLTVVGQALAGSRSGAAGAIVGINIGNLIWYLLAGAGLSALEAAMPQLFIVLRWAGILYLLWAGVQSWRAAGHGAQFHAAGKRAGFRRGLFSAAAVQLSNPKALLFFTVLLPPFLDMHRPVMPQIAALASIGISIEALVLIGYATLGFRVARYTLDRNPRLVGRVSGALLIGAALGIAGAATT